MLIATNILIILKILTVIKNRINTSMNNFKIWLTEEENQKPPTKKIILVNDGSFNPVHRGHINVTLRAAEVAKLAGLEVIGPILSPKHDSWIERKLKDSNQVLPAEDRYNLLSQAAAGTGIEVDRWEIDSPTYKTAKEYKEHYESKYPGATYVMIIGDDYGSCKPTPCFETKDDIWYIRMPRTEGLSSTKIRNAISRGEPLDDLASEPVRQYMLGRQAK